VKFVRLMFLVIWLWFGYLIHFVLKTVGLINADGDEVCNMQRYGRLDTLTVMLVCALSDVLQT
jgi:hypothetical protein